MNSTKVPAELKQNTLKAAKKAYRTRKILQTGSATLTCAAIIVSAVLFFPPNSQSPDITTETAAKEVYEDEYVPEDEPLVMYSISSDINALADLYNNIKGVRRVETLPVYESTDIEALSGRLVRELTAGQGPDIIYLTWNTGMMHSIEAMADAGYFADMDMVINSHDDFNWAAYNRDVMDAAILGGKRYFIPCQYNVPCLVSTGEKFGRLGLHVPEIFDMEAFLELAEAFYANTEEGSAMFSSYTAFHFFLDMIKDGRIQKTDQTERYFETMKKEFQKWKNKDSFVTSDSVVLTNFINSDTLFYPLPGQKSLQEQSDFLDRIRRISETETGSGEVIVLPSPLNAEGVGKGYIPGCFAINANSPLKNEAFGFIKYVLSDEIQMSSEYISNIPVSNEAFHVQKQSVIFHAGQNGDVELAERMMYLIEGTTKFEFRPVKIYLYVKVIFANDDFNDYLEGTVSFGKMADSVNADLEKKPFHKP